MEYFDAVEPAEISNSQFHIRSWLSLPKEKGKTTKMSVVVSVFLTVWVNPIQVGHNLLTLKNHKNSYNLFNFTDRHYCKVLCCWQSCTTLILAVTSCRIIWHNIILSVLIKTATMYSFKKSFALTLVLSYIFGEQAKLEWFILTLKYLFIHHIPIP